MTFTNDGRPLMPGELAKAMGCSRPVIDKALRAGIIPHVRLGHRIFIPRRIATEILENGRIPPIADDATQPPAEGTATTEAASCAR